MSGGYARPLTDDEQRAQQNALAAARRPLRHRHHHRPGARAHAAAAGHRRGASRPCVRARWLSTSPPSALGGNVALAGPARRIVIANGVTVIGAGNLPATDAARPPPTAYSRNVCALLRCLMRDGVVRIDLADEIQAGVRRHP